MIYIPVSQAFGNPQIKANNLKFAGTCAGENQQNWAYANANNQKNQIADQYTQPLKAVVETSYATSYQQGPR